MEDVAHDQQPLALQRRDRCAEGIEVVGEGIKIEQALAGVAVQAITPIEHHRAFTCGLKRFGQLLRNAGVLVTDHQHVGPHGHIGTGGIEQRFPFAEGAAGRSKALDICR